jgi:hypothetical protein
VLDVLEALLEQAPFDLDRFPNRCRSIHHALTS